MISRTLNILITYSLIIYSSLWAGDEVRITGRGPFQIRNQFPLNQQFLSFTADDAFNLPAKDIRVSLNYSQANTFAQSPEALNNLYSSDNRLSLSNHLTTIKQNSNRFLIDSGSSRIHLNLEYGMSDDLTFELDVPYLRYHGGFLDTPIEMVHQMAGFPYASRAMLKQNTSQIYIAGNQQDIFLNSDALQSAGIGDILLIAKGKIYNSYTHGLTLASRIAIKFPTGNYRQLRGSGSFDFGIDLTASKNLRNSILSTNVSGVLPGKWKMMPEVNIKPALSWMVSYEYLWGKRLSLIFQNEVHTSHFSQQFHQELSKSIFEWTAGVKYDVGAGFRVSFAITENYIHHNNTADFGFHFGLSRGF